MKITELNQNAGYMKPFERYFKRQNPALQTAISDWVDEIIESPFNGQVKKVDLKKVWVQKFVFQKQEYLIAYVVMDLVTNKLLTKSSTNATKVVFYNVGSHENFYRDLKNYIKSRKGIR